MPRNIIEKFCREVDANGRRHGDRRARRLLQREHIVRLMSARSDKPESANGLCKALRALMQHAVSIKLRLDDPNSGREADNVAQQARLPDMERRRRSINFRATHPVGSRGVAMGFCGLAN